MKYGKYIAVIILTISSQILTHRIENDRPLSVVGKGESGFQSKPGSDGMGSIPAIPDARNVPLLLYHQLFNEASLPASREWVGAWGNSTGTSYLIPDTPDTPEPSNTCTENSG